jgi:hypothetical protein
VSAARRIAPLLIAGIAAAALLAYLAVFAQLSTDRRDGTDFTASYVAGQMWRDGQGGRLYDQGAEIARHNAQMPTGYHVDLPFITPPPSALLAAAFTPLPIGSASVAGALLELALVAAAVALALKAAPRVPGRGGRDTWIVALVTVAGLGTYVMLLMGQWDGLCALALAGGYAALRRQRPATAGFVLAAGFAMTKPHLAIGLGLFLLGTRRPRAIAGAAAGVAAALALGIAVAGVHGWTDWLSTLGMSSDHSPLASLLGFTGFFGSWVGDNTAARVLAGVCSVAAALACARLGDSVRRSPAQLEPALAGAVALSLVAAPHLLLHDLAVLAPAAAWTLAWAAGSGRLRAAGLLWALLNLAALADLGNSASAPPGRLVPLALVAAGAAGWAVAVAPARTRRRLIAPAAGLRYSGSGSGAGGVVDQS